MAYDGEFWNGEGGHQHRPIGVSIRSKDDECLGCVGFDIAAPAGFAVQHVKPGFGKAIRVFTCCGGRIDSDLPMVTWPGCIIMGRFV